MKGGSMDTDGVLKLDKCLECGLLFPVGAEHVCEVVEPVAPPAPRNHNKLGWWIMGVLVGIPLLVVGVGIAQTAYNISQIDISTVTTWAALAYRAADYDEVSIGMSYTAVASALQGRGEVESTYTDSDGTRIEATWHRGDSYISVTFFNGRVTDKFAKGLNFR